MIAISDIPAEMRPYQPRGAALKLFYCKDTEILNEGPAGTGKSRAALEKAHLVMMKYGAARGLLVRKTRKSMTQSTLVTFEEKVVQENYFGRSGASRQFRQSYEYPNGSELVVGGMDDPGKILSTEFDLIVVDEATEISENDWETLLSRLRNHRVPYQQAIACCNPDFPAHWLNQRANKSQMTRLLSRHEDNPACTPEYLAILDRLTGVRKLRLREGVWSAAEGRIYDNYDPSVHVITADLPWTSFKKFVASADWGFSHAGVMQVWGIDHDGRMILVREVFQTEKGIDWWVAKAKALQQQFHVGVFSCDSARPDHIDQMRKAGVPAIEAYKSVQIGIDAVRQRLHVQPDGKPRLMLMADALDERDERLVESRRPWCTAQEFDSYVWAKTGDGRTKEEPVKENDDGMDATRYMVAYVDNLSSRKLQTARLGEMKNGKAA